MNQPANDGPNAEQYNNSYHAVRLQVQIFAIDFHAL